MTVEEMYASGRFRGVINIHDDTYHVTFPEEVAKKLRLKKDDTFVWYPQKSDYILPEACFLEPVPPKVLDWRDKVDEAYMEFLEWTGKTLTIELRLDKEGEDSLEYKHEILLAPDKKMAEFSEEERSSREQYELRDISQDLEHALWKILSRDDKKQYKVKIELYRPFDNKKTSE